MKTLAFWGILLVILYLSTHCEGACDVDEFKCSPVECIPDVWRCDGEPDCKNKSDEKKCKRINCNPETEYECTVGGVKQCIPIIYRCDEDPDCDDESDEDPARCRAPRGN